MPPGPAAGRLRPMTKTSWLLRAAVVSVALAAATPSPAQPTYDLLFRGGRVVDGTGAPWFAADVAVRDGRIAAVGRLDGARATRVVDATGLVIAPGLHRPARPVRVQRAGRRPGGLEDHAGHHHRGHRRGGVDRAARRSDARRWSRGVRPLRVHPGLPHARRLLRGPRAAGLGDQHGDLRRCRGRARPRDRRGGPPGHTRGAGADVRAGRRGDARGRARALLVAAVRSRHVQLDRGAGGDGEGGLALRRGLLHAPALGVRADRRLPRRGLPDRLGSGHPHPGVAPEDGLPAELRTHGRGPGEDRGRPGPGHRRGGQRLPVEPGLERARRLPAAVGAGGRARGAPEAPRGPRHPGAGPGGHGRGERRVGEPVAGRGRRPRASWWPRCCPPS